MKSIGILPLQDWLCAPTTREVMHALKSDNGDAKFVGGCVRDTLLSQPVHDIDIATTETPEKVIKLLTQAHIKTVPVGLEHGSVLAIKEGTTFHITTLRADLETDGRRAKVGFTQNWYEDAQRRDFTMNALYADIDGAYYDPCAGLADLQKGRVIFIGDPVARIREDYLRILRFFRFHSCYGEGFPDLRALEACNSERTGLKGLSGERIWTELSRLLMANNPVPSLKLIESQSIWATLFNDISWPRQALVHLERLIELEAKLLLPSHPFRRFALLSELESVPYFSKHLRWSQREKNYLHLVLEMLNTKPNLDIIKQTNRLLYDHGRAIFQDIILLLAAKEQLAFDVLQSHMLKAQMWSPLALPVQGQDLLELGIKSGPQLGAILKELEAWWIEKDFKPSREDCLEWVKSYVTPQI
jgi:poly(A) polymerase